MKVLLFCAVFFLLVSCEKEKVDLVDFTISSIEVPSELKRATSFCFVLDNKAYVGCGRNEDTVLNDFWEFDPENLQWARKNNFPGIARVGAIASSCNGKAYVGLGYVPNGDPYVIKNYLKDFYEYSVATDSWKRLADFPAAHSNSCFAFSCNDKIFVSSGFDSQSFGNETWMYDPAKDLWTEVGAMKEKRANALSVDNGRIFAGLGYNGNLNDWYEFDTLQYVWASRAPMPDKGRMSAISFVLNDKIFVAGGRHWGGDGAARGVISKVYQYHYESNSWTKSGDHFSFAREKAVCFSFKNRAFYGLGENESGLKSDFYKIELK
jgi:N-acetylneuraminic acid mutarotase